MLQSWAKNLADSKKIQQNWTRLKNFDIELCVCLTAFVKVISGKGTGH